LRHVAAAVVAGRSAERAAGVLEAALVGSRCVTGVADRSAAARGAEPSRSQCAGRVGSTDEPADRESGAASRCDVVHDVVYGTRNIAVTIERTAGHRSGY